MGRGIKVAVLGANSFSGQDFVDLLLEHPQYHVIGVSRSPERSAAFLRYKLRKDLSKFDYHQIDINTQFSKLTDLLDTQKPEWIVNFAAQSEVAPSWQNPQHWFQTNCVALAHLVNHLRQQTYVKKFLQISSPEVYGNCVGKITEESPVNPNTPYAASKYTADLLLKTYHRQFEFPVLTVRATNVYGARQQLFKIIPKSVRFIKLGRKIPLDGGGVAVKSYIHIRDISKGELAILEQGTIGDLYHLSPEKGIAVRDLVKHICGLLGKPFKECATNVEDRPGQDAVYVIDSAKARKAFGWKPTITLDEGLAEVVTWMDEYWPEIQRHPLEYQHKP